MAAKDTNKSQDVEENGRLITESIIEQSEDDEDHDHETHKHKKPENARQLTKKKYRGLIFICSETQQKTHKTTVSIDKEVSEIKENKNPVEVLKRNLVNENNVPDSVELRKMQKPKKDINFDLLLLSIKTETAELILKNVIYLHFNSTPCF